VLAIYFGAQIIMKKTLRLEGVNSLKAAVRARAIKEIQKKYFNKRRGNLNFARRNFFERKDQENKKRRGKRKTEQGVKKHFTKK